MTPSQDPARLELELPHVRLAALTWGPVDGPLAVLLHGYPDSAYSWRLLGPLLGEDGWRVVAPFSRGYAPSGVPTDGRGDVGALMADAVGVHEALAGGDDAVLVGHDWGGITANALAAHPDSPYRRVVSMSVPPFAAMQATRAPAVLARQARLSWYIAFQQLPVLPERVLDRLVPRLWADWSPGHDAAADLPHALASLAEPENRRAALAYYRHLVRPVGVPREYRRWQRSMWNAPRVPVLYLHGADDGALDVRFAAGVAPVLPAGSQVEVIEHAGHFLQLEQPERVNGLVRAFLAG